MEVHHTQPTPTSQLTFSFIGDFLPSSVISSPDYGVDCSSLPVDVSVPSNQEFSPNQDSSVYISSALRLASEVPADFSFSLDENIHIKPEAADVNCAQCHQPIDDKYFLNVNGRTWHENCLQCSTCESSLNSKCYSKDSKFYCKGCYFRFTMPSFYRDFDPPSSPECGLLGETVLDLGRVQTPELLQLTSEELEFGPKCASCDRIIQATDWVRRARNYVYHLACFACNQCRRQLSTGEEYALQEGKLLCKQHFVELVEGESGISNHKAKTKRVRTTFAEEQLSVLQTYFNRDSNPDGADLEKIATMTGLSKRVTQVWFQNSRARQKKWHQKSEGDNDGSQRSSVGPLSPGQKSDSSNEMMYPTSVTTSAEDAIPENIVIMSSLQFE